MSLSTILLSIALIVVFGGAIYFWSDAREYRQEYRDAITVCQSLNNELKEAHSFQEALDKENEQLTVKCYQYEALLGERLYDIPVADLDECNQEKCDSGECCKTCEVEGCPDKEKMDISFKKPCCSCDNGVYDVTECIGCGPENSYENYKPLKYI